MREEKEQQYSDELDIEIVAIDNEQVPGEQRAVRASLAPRFSLKQRRVQVFSTVGIVTLLLAVIVGSSGAIRNKIVQTLLPGTSHTSVSTLPIVPGTDRFFVSVGQRSSSLFIDGKPIVRIPNYSDHVAPLRLARGTHTLVWKYTPFPPQSCIVSVPNEYQTDTCGYDSIVSNEHGTGWNITFFLKLSSLSPSLHDALVSTVRAILQRYTSTTHLQTGDVYATNVEGTQQGVAREPLNVITQYELDIDTHSQAFCGPSGMLSGGISCIFNQQDCRDFCPTTAFQYPPQDNWNIYAVVHEVRDFVNGSGVTILPRQVDKFASGVLYEHAFPLQIGWDGATWHVTVPPTQGLQSVVPDTVVSPTMLSASCDKAANRVGGDSNLTVIPHSTLATVTTWNYFTLDAFAPTCLGIVTVASGQASPEPQKSAYCLYRLGILVAVNDIAHKYWPDMPRANASEQQFARQLADAYQKYLIAHP